MLVPFARLVEALFPSIGPELRRAVLAHSKRYADVGATLFASDPPEQLMQGDVVGPLLFERENESGEIRTVTTEGMLLSNSCDFDNDPWVLFAPCYVYELFAATSNAASIRANEVAGLFFLPRAWGREPFVVDFRTPQAFNTKHLQLKLSAGQCARRSSLSEIGWYFFIAKLTMHFLRPQPIDEARGKSRPPFLERLVYGAWQLPRLVEYVLRGH